jgi:hypothetical protein
MYLTSKPRLRVRCTVEILIVPLCALYVHDVPGGIYVAAEPSNAR